MNHYFTVVLFTIEFKNVTIFVLKKMMKNEGKIEKIKFEIYKKQTKKQINKR